MHGIYISNVPFIDQENVIRDKTLQIAETVVLYRSAQAAKSKKTLFKTPRHQGLDTCNHS